MLRFIVLALLGFFFLSQHAVAEDNKNSPSKTIPIETMQQIDRLDRVLEKSKELSLLVDSISRQKYSDCMKAFGNPKFCLCLKEKSPVGVDFSGYIKVVTTTKYELGYSKADKETKQLIDNTLQSREACVIGSN